MLWIQENLATIIIAAVLAAIVAVIIVNMARKKKHGKSSCGCGCSGCSMSDVCHKGK